MGRSLEPSLSSVAEGMAALSQAITAFRKDMAAVRSSWEFALVPCPVCGAKVMDLHEHASELGDRAHVVLEVMKS